jgi:hypothetical protein
MVVQRPAPRRPREIQERNMSQIHSLPIGFTAAPSGNAAHAGIWRTAIRHLARALSPGPIDDGRLSAHMLNDIGLLPEQSPDEPIWGHGGIMWRP